MKHLNDLNELAARLAADDDSATTNRISVGVFVFHERKTVESKTNP